MIRLGWRAALVPAVAGCLWLAVPAFAQQQDVRDLLDRIERLERDLSILQSQFYRSQTGSGGTTVITSPAAGASAGGPGAPISGDVYNQLDQRISAVEDQLRDLTGKLEQAGHDTAELRARLDRMQADNDVRFKEIEQKLAVGAAAPAPGPAAAAEPPAPAAAPTAPGPAQAGAGGQAEWNPTMGSAPHPLGQLSQQDLSQLEPKNVNSGAPAPAAAAAAAPPAPAPALVGKTPQEQYDYAFGLLRANDNDGATRAFQAFVAQHPNDPLAGNATYWLGQIYFTQGKYELAAPIFFDAYRKYPKSAKAGDSLLKVGLSMSALGKKKEACAALNRFSAEFPDAGDTLKRQAAAEKQKLACPTA